MSSSYLSSTKKQFEYYKQLGEQTFDQLGSDALFFHYNNESNSIAVIVQHMVGNMLSRWTDFRTTDGEKEWRNRETEFANIDMTRDELMAKWEEGWQCLFNAIDSIDHTQLEDIIYIRNQGHTILEALNRQLAHYPYHIGQIVYIGKMIKDQNWQTLSIPKGQSSTFNQTHFSKPKERKHFTDDLSIDRKK